MSSPSDYKRVRHHHYPGDVSKAEKIYMREHHKCSDETRVHAHDVHSWVRMIEAKTRAVLKRRAQQEIVDTLE